MSIMKNCESEEEQRKYWDKMSDVLTAIAKHIDGLSGEELDAELVKAGHVPTEDKMSDNEKCQNDDRFPLPPNCKELLLELHGEFYGRGLANADAFRMLPDIALLIPALQDKIAELEKANQLVEKVIEDQRETLVGSKKYFEDKIAELDHLLLCSFVQLCARVISCECSIACRACNDNNKLAAAIDKARK